MGRKQPHGHRARRAPPEPQAVNDDCGSQGVWVGGFFFLSGSPLLVCLRPTPSPLLPAILDRIINIRDIVDLEVWPPKWRWPVFRNALGSSNRR